MPWYTSLLTFDIIGGTLHGKPFRPVCLSYTTEFSCDSRLAKEVRGALSLAQPKQYGNTGWWVFEWGVKG